ncbi:MAG TPA: response regulator [Ktedonobacteraceae bacterium]|nr:response regulator [Ktedonobacteraceae bacterium]
MYQAQQPKRILIVEDEAEIRLILIAYLEYAGFVVQAAAHGQEAIAMIPKFMPHLVVLDLMMQPMSGWEVLAWLRARQITPLLPVIILTALSDVKEQVQGFEEGAIDYLAKPTQPSKILERVRAILSLSPEQRQVFRHERMEQQRRIFEQLYTPRPDEFSY